jgi:hypothetical protein
MRVRRAQRRGNGVPRGRFGWHALPEGVEIPLRKAPWLASWNRATDLDQVRSQEYLEDTIELLAPTTMRGPWTLMLDVGLSARRDHIDKAALHNYGYPLPSAVPGVLMAQSVAMNCAPSYRCGKTAAQGVRWGFGGGTEGCVLAPC